MLLMLETLQPPLLLVGLVAVADVAAAMASRCKR
jgi:hypothetical protein